MRHGAERLSVTSVLRHDRAQPQPDKTVSLAMKPVCLLSALLLAVVAASLTGCNGVIAFPERVTSATVKMVPVAGHVVAKPLDWTADAID